MFLKEWKYIKKEKTLVVMYINEDIESFSSNSDEEQLKNKYHNVF